MSTLDEMIRRKNSALMLVDFSDDSVSQAANMTEAALMEIRIAQIDGAPSPPSRSDRLRSAHDLLEHAARILDTVG